MSSMTGIRNRTSLALVGRVTPAEALPGFSNLALITGWALLQSRY